MGIGTSPLLGLSWDRSSNIEGTGDIIFAEDNNCSARFLEHTVANVLLSNLVEDGIINRSPDVPVIDETTARIAVPDAGNPIIGFLYGKALIMTHGMEATATADSGDTTYLIDGARTEANGYWVDAYILFTSGLNNGQMRQVTAFDGATDKLTWVGALPVAVALGDTYTVTFFHIQSKSNNSVNYVYARSLARTPRDAVVQWVANITGIKTVGDILIAKVWLDVAGNVEEIDASPDSHDRNLWTGAGAVHLLELSGSVIGLAGGAYVDITRGHHDLILFGPVEVTISNPDISYTVIEWNRSSQVVIRLENTGAYIENLDYVIHRWGRRKIYL